MAQKILVIDGIRYDPEKPMSIVFGHITASNETFELRVPINSADLQIKPAS